MPLDATPAGPLVPRVAGLPSPIGRGLPAATRPLPAAPPRRAAAVRLPGLGGAATFVLVLVLLGGLLAAVRAAGGIMAAGIG